VECARTQKDLSAGRRLQLTQVGWPPDMPLCSAANAMPYHYFVSSLFSDCVPQISLDSFQFASVMAVKVHFLFPLPVSSPNTYMKLCIFLLFCVCVSNMGVHTKSAKVKVSSVFNYASTTLGSRKGSRGLPLTSFTLALDEFE
jgi:hypothetical protein